MKSKLTPSVEDKDKTLLLTMQYAMNQKRIKIPWDFIAKTMGPKYSEGSIVQHLSKLRERCADAGIPVPPGLRKGGRNNQGTAETHEKGATTNSSTKAKKRGRKQVKDDEESSEDTGAKVYDSEEPSDEEYGTVNAKGKRKAKATGNTRSKRQHTTTGRKTTASNGGVDAGEDSDLSESEASSQSGHVPSQQHYAAGDGMWDLDGDDDAETKTENARTSPSSASSDDPRKILKLKIGVTGFEKLGLAKSSKKVPGDSAGCMKPETSSSQGTSYRKNHGNYQT